MEMEERIGQFRGEFNEVLRGFFDSLKARAEAIGQPAQQVYEIIKDFTLQGGKRLRPFLVCTAYDGYGGRDTVKILKASCAVELMQSHLLIHDDIFDRACLRRGYPTVHKVLERLYSSTKPIDGPHLATSLAILAGNLASQYGVLALSQSGFPGDLRIKALNLYASVVADESYGQILDMQAETGQTMTENDIMTIFYYKTTRYSVEGPLHLGAILADAPESELRALSSFAKPVGNIFQMQDDIVGLFGSEEVVGKPVGSDLREGKQTLLLLKAFECASDKDRELIGRSLATKDITQAEIRRVREIVTACGSLQHAEALIDSWIAEAKEALQRCALVSEAHGILSAFSEYVARPKYSGSVRTRYTSSSNACET